ncbi:hypothetical protein ABXS75_00560 [Roseburia hominis]
MAWNPNEYRVEKKNYAATKRIPIGILEDISSSTADVREIINRAMEKLIKKLKETPNFQKSVDLLVIFFNGEAEVKVNFEPLENVEPDQLMIAGVIGYTDTGRALLEALRLLEEKKKEYKANMIEYWQPKLFLLTDGYPSAWLGAPDSVGKEIEERYMMAAKEIRQLEEKRKLSFAAAGIQRQGGASANMSKLKELGDHIVCVSEGLSGMNRIESFFELIGATVLDTETPMEQIIHHLF